MNTPQAMETVFRFSFPKHLVEECVDLRIEEADFETFGGGGGYMVVGGWQPTLM